jgi:hypothetical protein
LTGRASEELTASTETGRALEVFVETAIFNEASPEVDFEDVDGPRVEQVVSWSEVGRETDAASATDDEVALACSEIIETPEVGRRTTGVEVIFTGIDVVLATTEVEVESVVTGIEVVLAATEVEVELAATEVEVKLAVPGIEVELTAAEVEVELAATEIVVA